ncbi:MAG: SDR family oxidoreductase [Pseudomonadota bacterium]
MIDTTKVLLSFGHGYSARALGRLLLPQGWRIIGTTRSAEKAEALAAEGVEPILWPGGDIGPALSAATHLLTSIAPRDGRDPVLTRLRPAITAAAPRIEWAGYLSTVGVYGDRQGGWVDETSGCRPATERGRHRLIAEQGWQALSIQADLPVHIFRIAGIYGPGRGPFAKIRAGTARRIIKPGQVFSRIHVEDIAAILAASIARPEPGAIYNLCDDEAAPPEEVLAYAADLLGLPHPPEVPIEDAEMSEMARSFYAESKRCSNRLIKEELGVALRYPTYREGLQALLASETAGQPS